MPNNNEQRLEECWSCGNEVFTLTSLATVGKQRLVKYALSIGL